MGESLIESPAPVPFLSRSASRLHALGFLAAVSLVGGPDLPLAIGQAPQAAPLPSGGLAASAAAPAALPAFPSKPVALPKRYTIRKGEFTVSSKLPDNAEIRVFYHVPVDADDKPAGSASDVVFYAPYINEPKPLETGENNYLRALTEVHGMTVFSMAFKSRLADTQTPARIYYYEPSGSYEALGRAWEKLRSELGLANRNLLVIGNSGGSTMAVGLALKYPQRIDAIALCGGSHFELLGEGWARKLQVPGLAVVTRGDLRYEANLALLAQARTHGANLLLSVWPTPADTIETFADQHSPHFHHSGNQAALNLMAAYLVAIRDARTRGELQVARWSHSVPMRFWTPGDQEANAVALKLENAVAPVPDDKFAQAYESNPNRFVRVKMPDGENVPVMVRYPSGGRAYGIAMYGGRSTDSDTEVGDALDVLGLSGWIGVGILDGAGQAFPPGYWEALAKWIGGQEQWKRFPVCYVGWEDAARDFLLLGATRPPSPVRAIAAMEGSLLYPEEGRSPIEALSPKMPHVVVGGTARDFDADEPAASFIDAAERAGLGIEIVAAGHDAADKLPPRIRLLAEVAAALSRTPAKVAGQPSR